MQGLGLGLRVLGFRFWGFEIRFLVHARKIIGVEEWVTRNRAMDCLFGFFLYPEHR